MVQSHTQRPLKQQENMSNQDPWVHTRRQYRPFYSYKPHISPSASMSHIHLPGPPSVVTITDSTNTYNRRRTTSNFPSLEPGHSAPTVARSGLTASASTNDLCRPASQARLRFHHLRKLTPTRIPTPVFDSKPLLVSSGHVSTPVLSKQRKENLEPKTLRLLGPISPTRNQLLPVVPKTRRTNVLSTLTSSFSLSSLNLSSTRQSSKPTAEPTISISATSSPPHPMFTTNIRQIQTAKPDSYWCGRFQSLHDRYQNEIFEASLTDPKTFRRFVTVSTLSPSSAAAKDKVKGSSELINSPPQNSTSIKFVAEDDDRRSKRVLQHLETLCVTNEAKKSLWEWQLQFARRMENDKLLPTGGKMLGDRGSWVNRVGRAISGGIVGGGGVGRRSNLSAFGKRRETVAGTVF